MVKVSCGVLYSYNKKGNLGIILGLEYDHLAAI